MVNASAPAPASLVPAVCLRSWNLKFSIPASAQAPLNAFHIHKVYARSSILENKRLFFRLALKLKKSGADLIQSLY